MDWPGNVRELRNFIWRLAILTPGPVIGLADLPLASPPGSAPPGSLEDLYRLPSFREARAWFEKEFLRRKLAESQGNVSAVAEKIGLERSHLYRKLRAYGLEPSREEDDQE